MTLKTLALMAKKFPEKYELRYQQALEDRGESREPLDEQDLERLLEARKVLAEKIAKQEQEREAARVTRRKSRKKAASDVKNVDAKAFRYLRQSGSSVSEVLARRAEARRRVKAQRKIQTEKENADWAKQQDELLALHRAKEELDSKAFNLEEQDRARTNASVIRARARQKRAESALRAELEVQREAGTDTERQSSIRRAEKYSLELDSSCRAAEEAERVAMLLKRRTLEEVERQAAEEAERAQREVKRRIERDLARRAAEEAERVVALRYRDFRRRHQEDVLTDLSGIRTWSGDLRWPDGGEPDHAVELGMQVVTFWRRLGQLPSTDSLGSYVLNEEAFLFGSDSFNDIS